MAVKITVRRPAAEPEDFEFTRARVTARPGGSLVIRRPWLRVIRRYQPGQWAGYDVELIRDRRRGTDRRRSPRPRPGRRHTDQGN